MTRYELRTLFFKKTGMVSVLNYKEFKGFCLGVQACAIEQEAQRVPEDAIRLAKEMVDSHYPSHREYKVAAALLAAAPVQQSEEQK